MKLPLIEALRVKQIGPAVAPMLPPMVLDLREQEAPTPDSHPHDFEYEVSATLGFRQTGPSGAEEMIKDAAIRAIAYEVYGPVEHELRKIREELNVVGLYGGAAMDRLNRAISVLRGEPTE
ncbi:hypothetical protein [Tritonibacter mobilis]|uniref:hypothetical protein n=1 Tax=Tritonibacter mobilis TaxID=379347 RepID=UPI000B5549EE|nr:hypothetical protein [Tritonibacter mobilis]ANH49105.1 hypothetical protein [Ruegeria phage 45A6]